MVNYCTVCMNNTRKNKNKSYFNFPKDSNKRHDWLKAVGREDLILKLVDDKTRQQYRICEDHFERKFIKFSRKGTVKYLFDYDFPTLKLPSNEGASSSSSQCQNASIQDNAFPMVNLPSCTEKGTVQYVFNNAFPTLKLLSNEGASLSSSQCQIASIQKNAFAMVNLPSNTEKGTVQYLFDNAFPTLKLSSNEGASSSSSQCQNASIGENAIAMVNLPSNTENGTVNFFFDNAFPTLKLPSNEGASSSSSQCQNASIEENAIPMVNLPSNTVATLNQFRNVSSKENQEIPLLPTIKITPNLDNVSIESFIPEFHTYHKPRKRSIQKLQTSESSSAPTALHLSAENPKKRKLAPKVSAANKNKETDLKNKETDLDSVTKEDFLKLCNKYMTKSMSQIIKWQIDLKAGCSGNRHSLAFKFFALNLYYSGPAAYRFLTNTLCLPSMVTMRKLVMPIGTKIDERLLYALKAKVDQMAPQEKICSVCVDCMSLKANLYYDVRNDRIVGFHEINGIQKNEPAKYVIVMMIRGIIHNWKQPIAHSFLSQYKNYPEVNEWIDEVIISLLNIGLDIRVFVSESGSIFIRPSKLRSESSDKTYFEVNGHKIFYMFDVPHLMTCVRNNFETCNFIFDHKEAKWSHIKDVYNQDKKRQIRLAPKLTHVHINPNHFQEMQVKLATQVLSRTVASAIYTHIDLNILDVDAKHTAVFVNKINKLFDILNSSTLRSPNKFKRAFRRDDYQINFLREMLFFFKNLRLISTKGQKEITNFLKFINGFQVSIKSLLQLSEDLQSEGIKSILTRRLNQDTIKIFFGKVRQAGGNCQEPTCLQFSKAFKKLFISNILKPPQNTNGYQDFDSVLVKPEDCLIFNNPLRVSQDSQSDEVVVVAPELTVGTSDYRFDLPEKNCLEYVSGYLYRKCLEQHKCPKINLYVNRSEQPLNTNHLNTNTNFYIFSHYTDLNVQLGFSIIPPKNFIAFVESLEHKFREYFDLKINIVNVGNEILKRIQDCKFDMPCECFPLDYLKKLYVRLRLYHTIKKHNKLLKPKIIKRK